MLVSRCHALHPTRFNDAARAPQLVSRLQNHKELCTKTRLALNLKEYVRLNRVQCSWIPETYVMTPAMNGMTAQATFAWQLQCAPMPSWKCCCHHTVDQM